MWIRSSSHPASPGSPGLRGRLARIHPLRGYPAAPYLPLLEQTFLQWGVEPLRRVTQRIRSLGEALPQAVSLVPAEWWRQAELAPQAIVDCLAERAERIEQIVELDKWEGIADAIRGGRPLDL